MSRQTVRRKIASLRRGPNARSHLGEEADARALWRSYKKQPIHPFVIKPPDLIVDANRRHWGAELEGDLDYEVDCLVLEGDPTPAQIAAIQMASAVHRADISGYDKANTVRMIREANPDMTAKRVAEEILDLDPSAVTRLESLWTCPIEVQEAARAGKIGVADWYAISKSPDPLATLALKLGGASAAEVKAAVKKQAAKAQADRSEPAPRAAKVKIPLAVNTEALTANGTVTVAGLPDEEIDLDGVEDLLTAATRAVREAKKRGYTTATFARAMKDMAAAAS